MFSPHNLFLFRTYASNRYIRVLFFIGARKAPSASGGTGRFRAGLSVTGFWPSRPLIYGVHYTVCPVILAAAVTLSTTEVKTSEDMNREN
jgi:hypothetical protein